MLCTVVISTNFHAKYGNKACKLCIQGLLYLLTLSRVKSRHFFKHLKLRMVFFVCFLVTLSYKKNTSTLVHTFRLWCYVPNLAELTFERIYYNDLIIILVTFIMNSAIKLIKRITTFQTKSLIGDRSDLRLCHRKIVCIS